MVGVLLLLILLAGSSRFKSRVSNWRFSSDTVVKATQRLVAKSPSVHNPVRFSSSEQTTVEHWDAYRWRVSGFVDSQPAGGARVRTLYFAVVQNAGSDWRLEDLQLQNIEAGTGARKRRGPALRRTGDKIAGGTRALTSMAGLTP